MSNKDLKAKALELKKQGLSYQQIADELGVGKTTVYNWILYAQDNSENNSDSVFSPDQEKLDELKRELAELRIEISEGANNGEDVSHLLEFRRLEMEHEYRMEELESNRRDNLFQQEIKVLKRQNEQQQHNYERSLNEVQKLSDLNSEMKSNLERLQKHNSELEDEVFMLEDSTTEHSEDSEDVSFPQSFVESLKELLEEYLEFDGADCTLESIELINDQVHELRSEIEGWVKTNDFNIDGEGAMVILEKFNDDVEEALASFENEDADELTLVFDEDWKEEVELWLGDS